MDEFNLIQAKLGFDDRAWAKKFLSKGGGAIYKRIGFSQLGRGGIGACLAGQVSFKSGGTELKLSFASLPLHGPCMRGIPIGEA